MRILIVGAGAIGGYFGGRLLEASGDVTFLVRPRRARQLARTGLSIRSPLGNADVPAPTVTRAELQSLFYLVLLSCKAYDLSEAMDSFAPAVGAKTAILPLLNGLRHIELLEERFGPPAVLGGQCLISATLDEDGRVLHLNDSHALSFGERDGTGSERVLAIASAFKGAKFEARLSKAILPEMWEKWVFIAAAAGIACLMRAPIGDLVAAGAADLAAALLDECAAIASRQEFSPREAALQRSRAMLTAAGSGLTPSMLRDVERGARTEADHVLGDLLRRGGEPDGPHSLLRIAFAHLNAYEARRARTDAASAGAPRT
jgi:2-dehydropantoate 2-reductase